MPVIHTAYETTNKATGLCKYHSQQSFESVFEQIRAVMKGIPYEDDYSAKDLFEWMSVADAETYSESKDLSRPFTKGEVFAALRHGGSEGYLVHLFAIDDGVITEAAAIKFLTDKEFAYRVAMEINEALNSGLFGAVEPPDDVARAA